MYSILLVVAMNWAGNGEVPVATTTLGSYNNLATCQAVAKQLTRKEAFPTSWNADAITKYTSAQCVQVRDKS